MLPQHKVFIIAEAGVNHNGSIETALQLVEKAAEAGVDAIKFQTWKTELVVTKNAPKPNYQLANGNEESQFEMLKRLELPYQSFDIIKKRCDDIGVIFMSTADEIESALFLNSIQDIFKVGSAELTDWPFLRKLAGFNKTLILSSGMSTLSEVDSAINVLVSSGLSKEKIAVLHCCSEYPAPFAEVNLRAIQTIKNSLNVKVGFSDHTMGLEASIAAVALGAEIIEKHFTLDTSMEGPDHQSSLNPKGMKSLVQAIRNIELALGDGVKKPSFSELRNMTLIRKAIIAKRRINVGEILCEENMTVKRPAKGVSPIFWDQLLGKTTNRSYDPDDPIEL